MRCEGICGIDAGREILGHLEADKLLTALCSGVAISAGCVTYEFGFDTDNL